MEVVQLRSLEIGDIFIHAKSKNRRIAHRFRVVGKPEFNSQYGSATRKCNNLSNNTTNCDKACNLKVIKLPIK